MQLKVEFLFIVLNIAFVQEEKVLSDQDDPLLHLCLQLQLVRPISEVSVLHIPCVVAKVQRSLFFTALLTFG